VAATGIAVNTARPYLRAIPMDEDAEQPVYVVRRHPRDQAIIAALSAVCAVLLLSVLSGADLAGRLTRIFAMESATAENWLPWVGLALAVAAYLALLHRNRRTEIQHVVLRQDLSVAHDRAHAALSRLDSKLEKATDAQAERK
jgi:hypothetical protein